MSLPPPENDDGLIFISKDKLAEIRAYGSLAIEDVTETLADEYRLTTSDMKVTYNVVKPDWFIVSGLNKEGNIVYLKTVRKKVSYGYGRDSESLTWVYQTLMIIYPKSQQQIYESYCRLIAKSL